MSDNHIAVTLLKSQLDQIPERARECHFVNCTNLDTVGTAVPV
jgi:hypothetical protein